MSIVSILEGAVDPRGYAERRALAYRAGVYNMPGYGGLVEAGGGFVSHVPQDRVFRAGTILDTEALYLHSTGTQSTGPALYLEAVRSLFRLFADRLPEGVDEMAHEAAVDAIHRRRLLDFFFSYAAPADTGAWLAGSLRIPDKYDIRNFPRNLMYLTPEMFSTLLARLDAAGCPSKLKVRGYLARPWFSAPHRLSHIDLYDKIDSRRTPPRITLERPYAAYSGLGDYDVDKTAYLNTNAEDAQYSTAEIHRANLPAQMLGVCTNLGGDPAGLWVPPRAVFVQDKEAVLGLEVALALEAQGKSIPIIEACESVYLDASRSRSVEDTVLQRVLDILRTTRGWTPELESLFFTCRMSASLRKKVRDGMLSLGLADEAARLEIMFPDRLLTSAGRMSVYASPQGYRIRRGAGDPEQLSNFTLEFTRNISFGSSEGILHAGKAIMRSREVHFMLRGEDLASPARLDKALKKADLSESGDLPALFHIAESRLLCRYLREEAARLPVVQGLRHLGWDSTRRRFDGPGFRADATITEPRQAVAHPGTAVLGCYNMQEAVLKQSDVPKSWGSAGHILIASCAYVVRCYLGLPLFPIAVSNSSGSRKILAGVFAGLGQEAPMRLGHNKRRTELAGVEGFPIYMEGYSGTQIQGSRLPGFVLAEEGEELKATPAAVTEAATVFPALLAETARMCAAGELDGYEEAQSTSRIRRLVIEGSQACTVKDIQPPDELYPALVTWMKEEQGIDYDLRKQTLVLENAGEDVLKELIKLDPGAELTDKGVFVKAVPVAPALELWYGRVPYNA